MEILLTLFIFALIIASIFGVITVGERSWQIGSVRVGLRQELREAMVDMMRDLRQCGYATISGVPANSSWYSAITFSIPEGVVGGKIDWEDDQIQYLLGGADGRQLLRILGAEQRVVANDIISFQVRRISSSAHIVEVLLQAEKTTVKGHLIVTSLNFQAKVRN